MKVCGNPLMSANHVFWEQEGVIHTCPQCAPFSFGYTGTDVYQIQALLDLYIATNGPHWYNSAGWPSNGLLSSCSDASVTPCPDPSAAAYSSSTWSGILCTGSKIVYVLHLANSIVMLDSSGTQWVRVRVTADPQRHVDSASGSTVVPVGDRLIT